MDCADIKELFHGYLESRLTPFQSAHLLEHCEACTGCRRELIELQARAQTSSPHITVSGFEPRVLKASLGAAGVLLVAFLAFYIFHRTPAHIATAKPIATDSSQPEVKPPASTTRESAAPATVSRPPPSSAGTAAKRFSAPTEAAKPRIALPQDRYAAAKRGKSADAGVAKANPSSEDDTSFDRRDKKDLPDAAAAEDTDPESNEKSADANELRFYSENPPYFFLYRPSMKPL